MRNRLRKLPKRYVGKSRTGSVETPSAPSDRTALPKKGKKDGLCNRSACQAPLAGKEQWFMKDHMTAGRLYYCGACARDFNSSDRRYGEEPRCQFDDETDIGDMINDRL